jgi:hypothetical protein
MSLTPQVVIALFTTITATVAVGAQEPAALRTAPERTDHRETTRYAEVVAFTAALAEVSPLVHLRTFGYTTEGRALPLVVVGRIDDASPAAVLGSGRTVVYLQGNIHAGEVEGKEALMMLIRRLAEGDQGELLDSLVLLVAPILNADGNERVTLTNRSLQHGPIGGTGTRANAQGLNINRDHMKLDSPEARSFARLLRDYDPHLAIDLHATNGTRHAYHLTYSPPLHPNTDPTLVELLRGRLLPDVTERIRQRSGWEFYYYGNLQGEGGSRGWYTFDYRALFNNNYLGLRNRIGLLSEAYAYATFADRIEATNLFLEEALRFTWSNATEIRRLVEAADSASVIGQILAVRAVPERSAELIEILLGGVVAERNPYSGESILRRTDERRPERMWEYGTFTPTDTELVPRAYLVPPELSGVLDNLVDHGIGVTTLTEAASMRVERFRIASQQIASRPFEGRTERTIEGSWEEETLPIAAGTVRVSMDQPLARLIFALLEPRSADGLATWGTFDPTLDGAESYPVLRVH